MAPARSWGQPRALIEEHPMNKVSRSLLFLAIAGVVSTAAAADAESAVPAAASFVNMAAQAGMTEVEAGKIALSKSQDPQIRSFAERMVSDHGKANSELASLAKAKGIDAPQRLDSEHRAMLDSLQAKSGPEFDAAYSQHMNMDHTKAIALFEGASRSADAEVAGFAQKTLPTLKEHKQLAARLPAR
jgi:putative membrane protein